MKLFKNLLLVMLALALALSLFACGGGGDVCTEHVDEDDDGICDICKQKIEKTPELTELTLIEEGEALFQIVLGEDVPVDARLVANQVKSALKKLGITVNVVDYDDPVKECEVIIGTVTNRGEDYNFNRYSLGLDGYAIQIVGTKVLIAGGSDETLIIAFEEFAEDILGIEEDELETVVMTSAQEVLEIQDDYDITAIKVGGNDIADYVIKTDISNALLYNPAVAMRDSLYKYAGYWLPIVDLSDNSANAVVITEVAKDSTPADSFRISVRGTTLYVEAEYANAVEKQLAYFLATSVTGEEGEVNLSGELYKKDVSVVTYEEFGAKGNGTTDDFLAIKAAHDYANISGQLVKAGGSSRRYYISDTRASGRLEYITIKTDVDWNNCTIIIDDTDVSHMNDSRYSSHVFVFESDYKKLQATSSQLKIARDQLESEGIGPHTTKLDLGLGYPAMLIIYNEEHRVYVRYGGNANDGEHQHELVLVDENGNIDPTTNLLLDYEKITKIEIIRTDVKPITVKNVTFEKWASRVDAILDDGTERGTYILRGLKINRSNMVMDNITHKVLNEYTTEEWRNGYGSQPYRGFFTVNEANNVVIQNSIITAYHYYGIHGTYGMSVGESNNVTFKNCTQSNYYKEDGVTLSTANVDINGRGLDEYWGVGGSSFSKNMTFDHSTLTRFDAHAGLYNGKITNGSKVARVYIIGGGTMIVEDSEITCEGTLVLLRQDYGSTWKGEVIVRNCTVTKGDPKATNVNLLSATWANHDFGYKTYFPNLTIDNVTFDGFQKIQYCAKISVSGSEFASVNNFHEEMLQRPGQEDTPNLNVYQPPEYAKILSNPNGYTFYYDNTIPFFEDTVFEGFTKLYE